MTAQTATLTDFLAARIEEDVKLATLATTRDSWTYEGYGDFGPYVSGAGVETEDTLQGQDVARYLEHMNPWRVLAECEAKRRIVEDAPPTARGGAYHQWERTLHILALAYADHPDFPEQWRI